MHLQVKHLHLLAQNQISQYKFYPPRVVLIINELAAGLLLAGKKHNFHVIAWNSLSADLQLAMDSVGNFTSHQSTFWEIRFLRRVWLYFNPMDYCLIHEVGNFHIHGKHDQLIFDCLRYIVYWGFNRYINYALTSEVTVSPDVLL